MMQRIYIGNLSTHTTERELRELFERAGRVVSVRIMLDRDTGRSKGFGFVEMGREEAEQAIRQLHRTEFNGHTLSVTEARPRPESAADQGRPAVQLFVSNLPYEATATELRALFSAAGLVATVSLPVDRESGKPRGFAFIEFPDRAQAQEAIRRFHNQPYKGRTIAVSEARARESRPPTPLPPRPVQPPRERPEGSPLDEWLSRRGQPHRQFGPDATSRRTRKQTSRGLKSERGLRRPIPERKDGQFFSAADDEPYDKAFPEESVVSQGSDPESGEHS
jgi:RNA recognition motif-containing protein